MGGGAEAARAAPAVSQVLLRPLGGETAPTPPPLLIELQPRGGGIAGGRETSLVRVPSTQNVSLASHTSLQLEMWL